MQQPVSNSNLHSCMNLIFIVYKAQNLCIHGIKACLREVFDNMFQMLVISIATTQDIQLRKIFIRWVYEQTYLGKQSISFIATDIWKDLPTHLKNSSLSAFPMKLYTIYSQNNKWNTLPAWHHDFGWARNVINACEDRETARRLGREQWETACMDRWPFWVVRMPAYGSFHCIWIRMFTRQSNIW